MIFKRKKGKIFRRRFCKRRIWNSSASVARRQFVLAAVGGAAQNDLDVNIDMTNFKQVFNRFRDTGILLISRCYNDIKLQKRSFLKVECEDIFQNIWNNVCFYIF